MHICIWFILNMVCIIKYATLFSVFHSYKVHDLSCYAGMLLMHGGKIESVPFPLSYSFSICSQWIAKLI